MVNLSVVNGRLVGFHSGVYIGRGGRGLQGSALANPFRVGVHGSRLRWLSAIGSGCGSSCRSRAVQRGLSCSGWRGWFSLVSLCSWCAGALRWRVMGMWLRGRSVGCAPVVRSSCCVVFWGCPHGFFHSSFCRCGGAWRSSRCRFRFPVWVLCSRVPAPCWWALGLGSGWGVPVGSMRRCGPRCRLPVCGCSELLPLAQVGVRLQLAPLRWCALWLGLARRYSSASPVGLALQGWCRLCLLLPASAGWVPGPGRRWRWCWGWVSRLWCGSLAGVAPPSWLGVALPGLGLVLSLALGWAFSPKKKGGQHPTYNILNYQQFKLSSYPTVMVSDRI